MSAPSELTMRRLTVTIDQAVTARPDMVEMLTVAIDHLEWATHHGLATDATWRDLTACIAAAALTDPPFRTCTPTRHPADDPDALQRPLREDPGVPGPASTGPCGE